MTVESLSSGQGLSRGADRRRSLVEAAFRQIAVKGLEGLRLRDVATAVGLDHSTLHHYFPTKEDLIADVVSYATDRLWTTVPTTGNPADQIRRHLQAIGQVMRRCPELFLVLGELSLRATRDPKVRAIIDRNDRDWRRWIRARLSQGTWPRVLDPATGTELIIAAIKGASVDPRHAVTALRQLARLLTHRADGTERKESS